MTDDVILIGLYARISEADDTLGVERQIRELKERLAAHPWLRDKRWRIVDDYKDNDISAYNLDLVRPEFERAKNDIRSQRINVIAGLDFDRIWRQPFDFEGLWRDMEQSHRRNSWARALLALEGDPRVVDVRTSEGLDMARIKGTISAGEVRRSTVRISLKHKELGEMGLPSGGVRRFGYSPDHLTIIEREAVEIRSAASRILKGESLQSVADDLNNRGIVPPGKSAEQRALEQENLDRALEGLPPIERECATSYWRPANLRRMLMGTHLIAIRTHHGKQVPAQWPAILDENTHKRLVLLFTDATRRRNPGGHRHAFTGVLHCPYCKRKLYRGMRRTTPIWYCPPAAGGCNKIARAATKLEGWLLEEFFAATESEDFLRRAFAQGEGDTDKRISLLDELKEAEAMRTEAEVDYYRPGKRRMSREAFERIMAEHDENVERIQRELRAATPAVVPVSMDILLEGHLRDKWEGLPLHTQRALLKLVLRYVELLPYPPGTRATTPEQAYRVHWDY